MLLIGGVGAAGIGGTGGLEVSAGTIGKTFEMRWQGRGMGCRELPVSVAASIACVREVFGWRRRVLRRALMPL